MGFNTQIRKALDDQLPVGRRFVALRGAVERLSPSGFNATFANLEAVVGVADPDDWTEAQIVEAAQLLRQSRAHHMQHRALWDDERRVAKAHGIRQPSADEWDRFGHRSWLDRVSYSPRSRYRWVGLAEWVRTNGLSPCPVGPELEDDYRSLLERLPRADLEPRGSMLAHYGPFPSLWEPATVIEIPDRIYNRQLTADEDRALPDRLRLLADAWYSRSHDGYVRQRHLKRLVVSEEHWVVPYVVAALGDYVVEIVEDVESALTRHGEHGSWHRRAYHHFAANNHDFIELVRQRAISYHHCYYTASYSRDGVIRPVYPAFVALDRLTEPDHYRRLYRVTAD